MTRQMEIVQSIFEELIQTGSTGRLLAAVADDTVTSNAIPPEAPFGGEYRGREGLLEYFRRVATVLEVSALQVTGYFESGPKVVVLGDELLRIKGSAQEFRSAWCTVFAFREHTISSIFVIEDHSPLSVYLAAHP